MKTAKDAPRHPCPKGSGERVREMKNTSVPSPIIDPNLDHPKGTHPYFFYPRYRKYLHVPEMRPLSVQIVLLSADRRHWEDIMQMSIYYTFFFYLQKSYFETELQQSDTWFLLLQILMNANQQMIACRSVAILQEPTTVHVTSFSNVIPLTGESVQVRFFLVFPSLESAV